METILENIIGAIEAVWFKLASLLNLEEVGTFDSLQPILANILADPLLLGLTLAILTIIPYTIHKIKSTYNEKEKRLNALLQELDDEDSDETDTKPLFQNQNTKDSNLDQPANESDSKAYGDEFESPSSEKTTIASGDLNQTPQEIFKNRRIADADFGWECGVEEWDELYDYISKPFVADKPQKEGESTAVPQKSEEIPQKSKETETASEDLRTPQEIFKNRRISDADFGWECSVEEWDELYAYISKPFREDKPAVVSSGDETSPESKEELPAEPAPKEEITANIDQSIEQTTGEPSNIGIDELAQLFEKEETVLDIDRTNEALAPKEEITSGIDQATEETSENHSNIGIDELASLIEEEELGASAVKSSTTSIPSTIETTGGLPAPETVVSSPVPQRVELTLEEVEPELESKPTLKPPIIESPEPGTRTPSAGPLLNSMLNSSVSAKTDALVSRLKTFQAELETRFQSLEKETETTAEATPTETLRKKQGNYQPAKVSYQNKQKSQSNKEYLRQLESFIFMARQKNKSSGDV